MYESLRWNGSSCLVRGPETDVLVYERLRWNVCSREIRGPNYLVYAVLVTTPMCMNDYDNINALGFQKYCRLRLHLLNSRDHLLLFGCVSPCIVLLTHTIFVYNLSEELAALTKQVMGRPNDVE